MAPDPRRLAGLGNTTGVQSADPSADGLAKLFNFKPAVVPRETIEFQEPRV